jgi:hypothetical protein
MASLSPCAHFCAALLPFCAAKAVVTTVKLPVWPANTLRLFPRPSMSSQIVLMVSLAPSLRVISLAKGLAARFSTMSRKMLVKGALPSRSAPLAQASPRVCGVGPSGS